MGKLSSVPVRTVRCPCGQLLGNTRVADGFRRCSRCVDEFARSAAPRRPSPQVTLPAVVPAPSLAVVVAETEATRTALLAKSLRQARERADRDVRGKRFQELRGRGLSIEDAIEQIEKEDQHGKQDD